MPINLKSKFRFTFLLVALAFSAVSLEACGTVEGAGRDIERTGEFVQEKATPN